MNELEEPIALGRTAEIYSYGAGKVLKLFFSTTPQPWIDKEIEIGRYIQESQLPVPKVYERAEIDKREGVVYERGDVARTSTILEAAKAPEGTPLRWLLEWVRKLFLTTYLKTYFQLRPDVKSSLAAWQAVMAANFLADVSVPGEEAGLRAIIERGFTQ